jgi:hypothetical protein
MPRRPYRYRQQGTTGDALRAMPSVLDRIGTPLSVQGYRYWGRWNKLHDGVLLKGTEGTGRFSALSWGYGGEGPRGLVELLVRLGVHRERAEHIAFQSRRYDDAGLDWLVRFLPNNRLLVLNREQIDELQGVPGIPRQPQKTRNRQPQSEQ